jgi:hypothetical protein
VLLFVLTTGCLSFTMGYFFNTTKESYNHTNEAYALTNVLVDS